MKIIILGAGALGVLSAYFLGRDGHEVVVVDRQPEPARETSYANGGQLSYSHAEPWANPYIFPKLFRWMWQEDAPLVLRFNGDPHMIRWGLRFLWNCRKSAADQHSLRLLRLGMFSKQKMKEVIAETQIDFHHIAKGILHVYSNEKEFEHAQKQAEFQHQNGCEEKVLSWQECVAMDPALAHSAKTIYGGIHAPGDESGDICVFTQKLAAYCKEKFKAEFIFDTEILSLNDENEEISHIATNKGNMRADAYIMAMGSYSSVYLRKIGVNVPIYPMKGYSITFPANEFAPTVSITDDALKIVYSRLGDRIRVAGTAEFAGYNTDIRKKRIEPIVNGVKTLFPKADMSEVFEWACLRPSTPDGPPIIGKTKYKNLFLNTGHGTLGWTQGAGSASLLADIFAGKSTEISMDGLTVDRYL
jgi:D-amino-acid dehydrogenase